MEEKNPKNCIKHKSHIRKVMFLCAVVMPHYTPCSKTWWHDKLGIWPIGGWKLAQRQSKNQPKGTLIWQKQNGY